MTKTKFKHVSLAFLVILGVVFFFSDAFAGTVSKGCKPLPERFAEMKSCILCPLFEVIIKTDQTIATKAYAALAPSFINVITVVLALFIAYHTLLLVSSFTKQDAPKYIGTILLQTFKVLLAVILLHDATHIYTYLINPLMNAGLEFGRALLFKDSSGSTGAVLIDSFNSAVSAAKAEMPEGVIGKDLLANIMGSVRMFSEAAAELPAVGGSLICISTHEGTSFLINFEMFFQGLAVYIFGWAIALACCFYLLDSAVRFGIFCVLLPFLIASWPFKITFKYTKTGFDIFMNTFFNFVMIGLVISLTTELLTQAIGGGSGGLDELEAAINGDDVEALKNMVSITGMDFLVLIACGMFAFKLVGQINSLAAQFGGGGGSSIGGSIGKLAAQGVGKVAGMAKKGGAAIGGAVYEGTGAKAKVDGMKDRAMDKMADIGAKVGLGNKARPGGVGGNRQFQSSGGGSGSGSGSGGGGSGGSGGGGSGGSGGDDGSGGGSGGSGGDDGSGDGSGGGDGVPRNENGNVVLPNGQEVNGLGVASRNSDGGVTFTSQGADGSRNIKSYDKDGNAHMSSFDKDGNKTSDYTINKDGSSKGFIKRDDGSIQQWDEKAGERKNEDNIF